jgi:hypothetical protein
VPVVVVEDIVHQVLNNFRLILRRNQAQIRRKADAGLNAEKLCALRAARLLQKTKQTDYPREYIGTHLQPPKLPQT